MSFSIAESCGIARLIDKEWQAVSRGLSGGKILGRIHLAEIKIGSQVVPSGFSIMETEEVIIGTDILKRYRTYVDFWNNVIIIRGEGVPFLDKADIPAGG